MRIPWNSGFPTAGPGNLPTAALEKKSPSRFMVSGRGWQFVYSVLAFVFGTAESKDDTADGAEDDQHKTHADTMAK